MRIEVIYPDGTSDMVRPSSVVGLMKNRKIIAFKLSKGWVKCED